MGHLGCPSAAGVSAVAGPILSPSPSPKPLLDEAYTAFAFQNNGEAMGAALRPPNEMVESIIAGLSGDSMALTDLETLVGSLAGRLRHEVLATTSTRR